MSRTAFKDNSSHYQLNGKKVPLKEVAALLRGSGIDLDHNRFLILQVCYWLVGVAEESGRRAWLAEGVGVRGGATCVTNC